MSGGSRPAPEARRPTTTRALVSWALYDWANSSFYAVIQTFVFAAYFTRQVAPDPATGTTQWAVALGTGGLAAALAGPLLGAIADQSGRRKPWIFAFSAVCIAATALMWLVEPSPEFAPLAMALVAVATIGAQAASVFYNAMLPGLAAVDRIGRWSGWGWGLGYAGGMACLVIALAMVSTPSFSFFDRESAEHVRASFLLVAAWFLVFSLPLFVFTPDESRRTVPWRDAVRAGARQLRDAIVHARRDLPMLRFIVAWMFCADGLATTFAFGGVFAAGTFDMSERTVIEFGIALNLVAGLGAAAFASVDDRVGGKRTMIVSLAGLMIAGTLTILAPSAALFWTFGLLLGVFVGPVQAASRSYLARVTPEPSRTQTFGFYALAGKATSFLGPVLVGSITYATGSQRAGLATVVAFFGIGLAIMAGVPRDDTGAAGPWGRTGRS